MPSSPNERHEEGDEGTVAPRDAGPDRGAGLTVSVVTDDPTAGPVDELREDSRLEVRTVDVDAPDWPDELDDAHCLIFDVNCPDRARELLERADAACPELPVVLAPREGSERLATVALRAGAAEYVPSTSDDLPARTLAAIDGDGSGADASDRFEEVLTTTIPDEAFVLDEDGVYLEARVRPEAGELYTVSAEELVGTNLEDVFPDALATELQGCIERTLESGQRQSVEYEAETTEGTRRFDARVVPIEEPVNGRRAVVWLARDITERARRERELRRRRDQLETLNGINRVVRRVIRTLVEAPTREDIEREVCEQLVASGLYCGAWIGESDGSNGLTVRTRAGEATTILDRVADRSVDPEQPVLEAIETGEIRSSNRVGEEPRLPEAIRRAARADDVHSAIVVPVVHDNTVYGALVAYARRDDAFSEREKSAFGLLGETIGFSINAVLNRRSLFADAVVELEIRVEDGQSLSFHLSKTYDCTCSLEWAGDVDGTTYQYVTVEGLDGETVMAEATDHESVDECRLIYDDYERCTLEVRFHQSGVRTLTNHGATVREITVEDGIASSVVEVPRDADVRAVIEALSTVYENVTLVAKREVDRPVQTATERRNRIVDRLTDRQLTALRLAYYGGYFDWPRGSTGEEIAESMGVSPPTMHQHLRNAQREVLTEFFDDRH
ncbi:bacterio-opsin activator domain-containing protein [Natronobeatus ordinarius]|uniref:bacterio-opsin activator domain-containing protein n=1 Tax=Natronobeatus ordinarius TaxID=2963433 RepID=UPI0020CCA585|nr:bacterio-opsin activator domain-containing protein [Natronobeatus ordinarius]